MKNKLRFFAVLLSAVTIISSCAGSPAQTAATAASSVTGTSVTAEAAPLALTEQTFIPDSSNVKLIGRTSAKDGILWLAHSASGIEFTFNGTAASVGITGDNSVNGDVSSQARFAVYVNGERTLDSLVSEPQAEYDIFSSEEPEDVTVRIVKLSESTSSFFGISGINVTSLSGISPTPAKDLKIEFIGDSITCGYGVDDEDSSHHFSTETEDATKTYAYKTAEKLGADYSLVAYSGHGIISGYTGDPDKKNSGDLVPPIYENFAKSYGSSSGFCDPAEPWDFELFVPDYIVVNLGTNDNSYIKGKGAEEKKAEFISEYKEFLKTIRKDNPGAYIVCTLGLMGDELCSCVEDATALYIDETGDNNISSFRLSVQDTFTNGIAADWHPSEKSHAKAADELSEYIGSL